MSIFSTDDMSEMNRLTRSGNPAAATALIQSVLARGRGFDSSADVHQVRPEPHQAESNPASPGARMRILNPEVRAKAATDAGPATQSGHSESTIPHPVPPGDQTPHDESVFLDGLYPGAERPLHYKLFKPSAPDARPAPLLVMLHGCTQDAQDFATGTAMNAIAQEAGLYVLYPVQASSANMNRCWNWFEPAHQVRGQGEPAMIAGLTRQIMKDYPIDASQVFIAGLSAGGAMALVLVEEYPELYAAVGVHSGLPTGVASSMPAALSAMRAPSPGAGAPGSSTVPGLSDTLSPTLPFRGFSPINGETIGHSREHGSPVPTIVFHGDRDHTVTPANAERIVNDWHARNSDGRDDNTTWVRRTDNVTMPTGFAYTVDRYESAGTPGRVGCEKWTLARSGHRWSGGNSAGSHTDAQGPDASAEMVRFFLSVKPA